MLDTYFVRSHRDNHFPVPLDVLFLSFLGKERLGERFMFKTFRKEQIQLAGIAGAVGVEPLLSDLQLGSAGIIEVDHSGCAGFILVGGGEGGREGVGIPRRQLFI